jgi:hypothetical protein
VRNVGDLGRETEAAGIVSRATRFDASRLGRHMPITRIRKHGGGP